MDYPLVSIAIISFNRLNYLKATLESAKECIQYPNIEWIISDNNSKEPGLREYIDGLDWVQVKLFGDQSHADAMNEIVEKAKGEYIFIWPQDIVAKDINDWILTGATPSEIQSIIDRNTFDGLRAKLEFDRWKKI